MSKTAFIFPGQGSQFKGMAKDLYESNAKAKELMDKANQILGFSITKIMFEGSEEQLKQTRYTQPAIFLHSVVRFMLMDEKPDAVAGHSLGEFSAMVAAGALSFEDGLRVVAARGAAMQQAGESKPGEMAAIIGMSNEDVEAVCESVDALVVPANFNATGQVVISGSPEGIELAIEEAKAKGCRMAKKLPVSGAFHSEQMADALPKLEKALDAASILDAHFPIYANFTAEPVTAAAQLRQNLLDQLQNPVRWTQSLICMQDDGITRFVEVGPGKVLQGLVKRTLKDVEIDGVQ